MPHRSPDSTSSIPTHETGSVTVAVRVVVTDALVIKLTGFDPAYEEAMGNTRDARVIRERAQCMWDALLAIAR